MTFPLGYIFVGAILLFLVFFMKNVVFGDKQWRGLRVNPYRFISFRFYNITIGSFRFGEILLRRILLRCLVKRKKCNSTYCQSADFFTYDQIDD